MEKNTLGNGAKARRAQGKHRCTNFDWRKEDEKLIAEHEANCDAFREIARRKKRTPTLSIPRIVGLLLHSENPDWPKRLAHKSVKSWAETYCRWRGKCNHRKHHETPPIH